MAATVVATLPVVHEDLGDEMILLDPAKTFFTSTVKKKGPATNVVYSEVADKRDSGRLGGLKDHQRVDRDAVDNAQVNRKQLFGVIQHFRETHGVSTLVAKTMDPAGIDDAFTEGRMKKIAQVKEDQEITYLSQQDCQLGSTSAEFHTRGASMAIDDTAQPNATYAVDATLLCPAAQIVAVSGVSAITEKLLRTQLQNQYTTNKGDVKLTGYCTPDFGTRFDDFFTSHLTSDSTVPVRQFVSQGGASEYSIGVTRYKTRYGMVDIVPSLLLNGTRNAASTAGAATTNTSTTVTFTSTAGMQPFMKLSGTGIPANAYIVSITNATTVVISAAATATVSPTLYIGDFDHVLFLQMDVFHVKMNMAPQGYEMPVDGAGRDGVVECISSLFCGYPPINGKMYTAAAPS